MLSECYLVELGSLINSADLDSAPCLMTCLTSGAYKARVVNVIAWEMEWQPEGLVLAGATEELPESDNTRDAYAGHIDHVFAGHTDHVFAVGECSVGSPMCRYPGVSDETTPIWALRWPDKRCAYMV